MSLAEQLKQLDDRVLPARLRVSYDSPRPLWLMYAGILNSVAAVAFVIGLDRAHGSVRLVLCLVAAMAFVANTAAAVRWDRAHRTGATSG